MKKYDQIILLILLAFGFARSFSQTNNKPAVISDSTKISAIPLEDIPIAAGETSVKILRLVESSISFKQLEKEKARNEGMFSNVDSLITIENSLDFSTRTARYLLARINYWNDYKRKIESQKEHLATVVKKLKNDKKIMDDDAALWRNTLTRMEDATANSTIIDIINNVIVLADSNSANALTKINEAIPLLSAATRYSIIVDNLIERYVAAIQQRQGDMFSKSHPSLIQIDYSHPEQWDVGEYLKLFAETDINALVFYYDDHETVFLFIFLFIAFLIALFIHLRKRIDEIDDDNSSSYEKSLKIILHKPFSAALIIGVFASLLFFSNRPPIFGDILMLILLVPLLGIILGFSSQVYYKYLFVFALLVLLWFVNIIFPPEIFLHRFILFIVGALEIIFLVLLISHLKSIALQQNIFSRIFRFFLLIHLAAACVGFITNITGQVRLAALLLNFTISNTLIGFLLTITAITLIGTSHVLIKSSSLQKFKFVKKRRKYLQEKTRSLVHFAIIILWLHAIMRLLGIDNTIYPFLQDIVTGEFSVGSARLTLGRIFLFFFVIWLSVFVARIIRAVLEDDVLKKMSLKKGVPRTISVMVYFSLITMGVFLAVGAVGMPLDQLTIIFSAFSVGLGFGLQNIVNNFVSGIVLLFERPVQIGDTIEVDNLIGRVKSMGIRSSNVRTFDGAEVIVPNGHLISNEVINWTLSDKRRRIEVISGVAYGSDVHKVQKLFLKVLKQHPDVSDDPAPMVLFNDLGASSLDFRLLFWTDNSDNWITIRSEVVFMIHDMLNKEGINIPFPQRDLHIKSISKEMVFQLNKDSTESESET